MNNKNNYWLKRAGALWVVDHSVEVKALDDQVEVE